MKKLTLTLTAVVVGLLFTSQVFAWNPGFGPGKGMGYGNYCGAGLEELKLTSEQKAKMESLQVAGEKEIRPIREKMFDKSVELRRLWHQADPDKDKIEAVQKELNKLREQKQNKVTAQRLEIRNVLTPEQKEKLAAFGGGRGFGFGEGRGMKGQRGGMRGQGGGFGTGICR